MYSHPYSQITVETEFDNPIYETGVSGTPVLLEGSPLPTAWLEEGPLGSPASSLPNPLLSRVLGEPALFPSVTRARLRHWGGGGAGAVAVSHGVPVFKGSMDHSPSCSAAAGHGTDAIATPHLQTGMRSEKKKVSPDLPVRETSQSTLL